MSQRDELETAWDRLSGTQWPARVGELWDRYGSRFASAWDDIGHHNQVSVYRIILALYKSRKPRTITTVEELDALPVRSVVLCTGNRMAMSVTKRTNDEPAGLDYFTAGNPMGYAVGEIPLPATVLYEPEAS